ncbi:hypothetical protein Bca4012_100415 [Brassica carinata]
MKERMRRNKNMTLWARRTTVKHHTLTIALWFAYMLVSVSPITFIFLFLHVTSPVLIYFFSSLLN